jgi:hypothetical protein
MFPPKLDRKRAPWPALVALAALIATVEVALRKTPPSGPRGTVETLGAARTSPDAYGRAGDLVLKDPDGPSITIGAAPNIAGHRPLLGAIVDVATEPGDVPDPLIWFRTVTVGEKDVVTDLAARPPQPSTCEDGAPGVRVLGPLGTGLTTTACIGGKGRFELTTTLETLPTGSSLADEVNVGSLPVVVARDGAAWDMEHDTSFMAFGYGGTAVLLEAPHMHVARTFSHFGAETFPSPVLVRYGGDKTISRRLHVLAGDVLDALGRLPEATRTLDVTFGADRGGDVSVRDAADRELATGHVARGATKILKLPPDFGEHLLLRDDRGVVTDPRIPLPAPGQRASVHASAGPSGSIALSYRDESGADLPVHVLFKGLDVPDPKPEPSGGRAYPAGRSLYVLGGAVEVSLAAGRYRVTASHGLAYSLSVKEVTVEANGVVRLDDVLRRVVDTTGWLSADFHLHSAPSPDSTVTLAERVSSLVTEGVDLAVATDHNRVTDLGPEARTLGVADRLRTVPGVEITSAGTKWGHFNAYPLPERAGAPEERVPVYFGKLPAEMFAAARGLGARVVQVNHARMDPGIGYFDQAHVDRNTGRSDPVFATDFDVLEAYNGMWIETPEKIREGPLDLVALARRGKHVAATGNSDSHKLLYEEAGYPRTWVHAPSAPESTRVERTLAALLARDTTVSSGPFVEMTVDGHGIGSVVRPGPDGSVHVHVKVSAPGWVPVERVEIWHDDTVADAFVVEGPARDGVRFERDATIATQGKDAVVLAWAEAQTPLPDVVPYEHARSIGFTGLVYVDADGDGRVKVPPRVP